jgi:hypothetical protein
MVIERLLFLTGHAVALIVLASTCYATGTLAVRRASFRSALEELCAASTIGFGITGTVLFLIGLARVLYAPVVVAYVLVVHVCALPVVRAARRRRGLDSSPPWRITVPAVLLAAVLGLSFLGTLYPPAEWDATMYHLPFAKTFARQHAVVFVDTLRFPVFPQLNEMLFAAMLLLYDDVATHAVEFFALTLTALLLYTWGVRWRSKEGGLLGAAFWLGNPIVISLGICAYIDAGLTLFMVAAVLFWETWRETESMQWLILSAASAGFAAGTKYHGLVAVAALAVATLIVAVKRKNVRAAAAFLLIAALSGGAFYVRTWAWTGNPVFPFFTRIFGDNEWRGSRLETKIDENGGSTVQALLLSRIEEWRSSPPNPVSWLHRLTYDSETLKNQVPYAISISLLLPLSVWAWWRIPRLRAIGAIAAGYLLLFAPFDPRFLLPSSAIFSLLGGIGLSCFPRRFTDRFTLPIALLLLAPGLDWTARQLRYRGLFPVTAESRSRYLSPRVPGYSQLELLNRRHGDRYTVYAMGMDQAHYFADGRMIGDHIGPYRNSLVTSLRGHAAARRMRAMGAQYLLLNAGSIPELMRDPELRSHLQVVTTDRRAELYFLLP